MLSLSRECQVPVKYLINFLGWMNFHDCDSRRQHFVFTLPWKFLNFRVFFVKTLSAGEAGLILSWLLCLPLFSLSSLLQELLMLCFVFVQIRFKMRSRFFFFSSCSSYLESLTSSALRIIRILLIVYHTKTIVQKKKKKNYPTFFLSSL